MNIKTLIIPDVHGRTFWKYAIDKFPKEKYPNLNIVFLGDYLDPYELPDEHVTRLEAIENFKMIIEYAKNDKRIHLLIGNHDMHYFYNAQYKSRVDEKNYTIIKSIFEENLDLFNVAFEEKVNRKKILYTHAGVTRFWLDHLRFIGKLSCDNNKVEYIDRLGNKRKKISDEQLPFCEMLRDMTPEADKLNKMLHNFQGQANLWMCSWVRGGDYDFGSCIWADMEEWVYINSNVKGNIWQIFGHTLFGGGGPDGFVINRDHKWAMLDSRQAWLLNAKGKLLKLSEYEMGSN